MGVAEPGVRPSGAASPSAFQEDEIPLAVMV